MYTISVDYHFSTSYSILADSGNCNKKTAPEGGPDRHFKGITSR